MIYVTPVIRSEDLMTLATRGSQPKAWLCLLSTPLDLYERYRGERVRGAIHQIYQSDSCCLVKSLKPAPETGEFAERAGLFRT
jgi:hypothetical protein